MKLVKDYMNDCTVYYWVASPEQTEALSPQFRTFAQAEEWWKECMFSRVDSPERRRDSRTSEKEYQNSDIQIDLSPDETRLSAMAIKVDLDLHKEKTQ